MSTTYSINRFRISISSQMQGAEYYAEYISHLFHCELKKLVERILSKTIPVGLSIRLESPLVLKLGNIPGAFFGRSFCQRLERALEQAIRQLLTERAELWTRDSPEQCRALLVQELRSWEEPADSWLTRLLELAPDIWLPILAEYSLSPEGAELYRLLREGTVRDLCVKLAPDIPQQGDVTRDSLWLCALYYFQQHPALSVPSVPATVVPGVPPELRVVTSAVPMKQYDVRLIKALFEHALSLPAPFIPWLRALWQHPVVVESVRPVLSSVRITQLHRLLAGNNLSPQQTQQTQQTQQVKPSRSGKRKSDSLSEEQWQPVSCAGMVLLWPMLPGLFRHLGLVEGKRFVSLQAQRQAAGCLLWLALRQHEPPVEQRVSRLLCGLPAEGEITSEDMPDDITCEQLRQWLTGMPALLQATWTKLSAEDIRQWFLLRPGWISPQPGKITLRIQPEAFDVLLNDWPWPVNVAPLPWFEQPLTVYWTDNKGRT